jgi:hypothetical protein
LAAAIRSKSDALNQADELRARNEQADEMQPAQADALSQADELRSNLADALNAQNDALNSQNDEPLSSQADAPALRSRAAANMAALSAKARRDQSELAAAIALADSLGFNNGAAAALALRSLQDDEPTPKANTRRSNSNVQSSVQQNSRRFGAYAGMVVRRNSNSQNDIQQLRESI